MYTVIHFEEDDTVEAVPSYWFSEDQCAWPILRSNIKRFIEKKIKPNDLEFYMLKARKLCGEISKLKTKILLFQIKLKYKLLFRFFIRCKKIGNKSNMHIKFIW